jgi:hypothetical protein
MEQSDQYQPGGTHVPLVGLSNDRPNHRLGFVFHQLLGYDRGGVTGAGRLADVPSSAVPTRKPVKTPS